MATAIIKCVLPGLTGYAAGDLRLALRLHSAAQNGAVSASNLSLTPDTIFADTYWTTVAGFAGLCDARITEGTTVRGFGYVLMDDTAAVHVVWSDPNSYRVWRRFFAKATKTATQIKTFADDGTTVHTTQVVSDDGTTETQGAQT